MLIVGDSPYQVNLIINVTMSMDPLTLKFDAFQVLPYTAKNSYLKNISTFVLNHIGHVRK